MKQKPKKIFNKLLLGATNRKKGWEVKFHKAINNHFDSLKKKPYYQQRYKNVHCLPLKKYPLMIHFTIDDENKIVAIRAVFHTSRNPDI